MESTESVEVVGGAGQVVVGVDTHLDVHVAVALDELGRRLGELTVPTTARGYERLLRWARSFGPVGCFGIEGTSSYGAGTHPLSEDRRHCGGRSGEAQAPSPPG